MRWLRIFRLKTYFSSYFCPNPFPDGGTCPFQVHVPDRSTPPFGRNKTPNHRTPKNENLNRFPSSVSKRPSSEANPIVDGDQRILRLRGMIILPALFAESRQFPPMILSLLTACASQALGSLLSPTSPPAGPMATQEHSEEDLKLLHRLARDPVSMRTISKAVPFSCLKSPFSTPYHDSIYRTSCTFPASRRPTILRPPTLLISPSWPLRIGLTNALSDST